MKDVVGSQPVPATGSPHHGVSAAAESNEKCLGGDRPHRLDVATGVLRGGDPVAGAVHDQQPSPGELALRLAGSDPRRERHQPDHAVLPRRPDRGAAAHRMTDQHHGHLAVVGAQLPNRPCDVVDRAATVSVPTSAGEQQPPRREADVRPRQPQPARDRHHPQHRDLAGRGGGVAVFLAAVQHECNGLGRSRFRVANQHRP